MTIQSAFAFFDLQHFEELIKNDPLNTSQSIQEWRHNQHQVTPPEHQRVTCQLENGETFEVNGMQKKGDENTFEVLYPNGDYRGSLSLKTTDTLQKVWVPKPEPISENLEKISTEQTHKEAEKPTLDEALGIGAFFNLPPLNNQKHDPLSFKVLKAEMDEEWDKLSKETELSLQALPEIFLKECVVPSTPLLLMAACMYPVFALCKKTENKQVQSIQKLAITTAPFFGVSATAGIYTAFERMVDRAILNSSNPSAYRKLTEQEAAQHIFKNLCARFEKHTKGLTAEQQDMIRTTRLSVQSKLNSKSPNLAELKIAIERYLIEIAYTALTRTDVATYDGSLELQTQSKAQIKELFSYYPEETRIQLELFDQHIEDISKSKSLPRRNFFLQGNKEIAAAGGIGKSLLMQIYCYLKGKTLLVFSIGEKGTWELTGVYNKNVRFDFSAEHTDLLSPMVFDILKEGDSSAIVFLKESGEAIANSSADNSEFNKSAMKTFSDNNLRELIMPGWGDRPFDVSGITIVGEGNIDITDIDEHEVGKTPAASSRRWTPIPMWAFTEKEKKRVFTQASTLMNEAFEKNGTLSPSMLANIRADLQTYCDFILEHDQHPGAPGVIRATEQAARFIRLGYQRQAEQRGKPFKKLEVEQHILQALKQVEQVGTPEKEISPHFTKAGFVLNNGEQTLQTLNPETPPREELQKLLAKVAQQRDTMENKSRNNLAHKVFPELRQNALKALFLARQEQLKKSKMDQ